MQITLFDLSFSHPIILINLIAPSSAVPDDPPASIPYFLTNSLANLKVFSSSVLIQRSMHDLQQVRGIKSYPIPYTLNKHYSQFNSAGQAIILPIGSAPTIIILGFFYFIFLEIPVKVPPVPAPATIASILPSVWSSNSSANWS